MTKTAPEQVLLKRFQPENNGKSLFNNVSMTLLSSAQHSGIKGSWFFLSSNFMKNNGVCRPVPEKLYLLQWVIIRQNTVALVMFYFAEIVILPPLTNVILFLGSECCTEISAVQPC